MAHVAANIRAGRDSVERAEGSQSRRVHETGGSRASPSAFDGHTLRTDGMNSVGGATRDELPIRKPAFGRCDIHLAGADVLRAGEAGARHAKSVLVGHRAWLDIQFESTTNLLESVRCNPQTSPWDGTVPKEGMAAFLT